MNHHVANKSSARFKILKSALDLTPTAINSEFSRRKLSPQLCASHFNQVYVLDRRTNMKHYALTFKNNKGGLQLIIPNPEQNKCYKSLIGPAGFTFFAGEYKSHIEVFRSYWDLLTWLHITKRTVPKFDTYVINSFGNVPATIMEIENRIEGVNSIIDFLPNNPSGDFTRELISDFAIQNQLEYAAQNYIYNGYNDLSDFWMNSEEAERFAKVIYN